MGLVGTFVYPVLQKRKGVIGTGGIAIWFQLSFLSLCVLSTAYASDPGCDAVHTELGLLISGVVLSRMGLWVFDLAVTQLLQQEVDDSILAIVNGTQGSVQKALDLLGYALSLWLHRPEQFSKLVYISFGSVFTNVLPAN